MRIGAEHGNTRFAQHVGHARHEWRFGADHHKIDIVIARKAEHGSARVDIEGGYVFGNLSSTPIAGSHEQLIAIR